MEINGTSWRNPAQANRIGLGRKWSSICGYKKPGVQPAFRPSRHHADGEAGQA